MMNLMPVFSISDMPRQVEEAFDYLIDNDLFGYPVLEQDYAEFKFMSDFDCQSYFTPESQEQYDILEMWISSFLPEEFIGDTVLIQNYY